MPRLTKALAAVVGAAALLLLAVWQVPQWLNWVRYRTAIETLASATLGQPVTIHGPISLTLLPQPVLTAEQVNVGGSEPAPLSIHVDSLRLRIALMPLVGGRVDARELVLHGPDLRIPFPSQPVMLWLHPPAWLAAFAARIEDGKLSIGRLSFTGIDATLTSLDTGALSAVGTAQFSGQSWHFTTRLTSAGADGAAGLDVTLDGEGKANGVGGKFTGQLARDGTLAGSITARGPNLALLLPTPPVPFRADGRLTVGGGLAAVDNLALELGGSPATGAVALRVTPNQRLDIALAASRLDFDVWLPALLKTSTTVAGFDLPIGIDLSAEAAPLGGGTLEHIRAAFDLIDNNLIVREASALMPGNGVLQLSGRVSRDDPAAPQFDGDVRIEAPVLRSALRWLTDAMPGALSASLVSFLPNETVQRAALAAHVVASSGEIAVHNLSGTLDDTAVTGELALKRGEPPVMTGDIIFDHLQLDPWLSSIGRLSPAGPKFDAEMRLKIHQATLRGWTIDGLAVDVAIEAGNALLRRLEATTRGMHVTASGMLGGGKLTNGRISLETADAAPLAEMLPIAWRATPALWQGPVRLELQASGPANALSADAKLMLADAQSEAAGMIDTRSGNWSGRLTVLHPGARRLIAALGLPERMHLAALPSWLGDGSLSLVAHMTGGPDRVSASEFDLTAATLHANGNLACDVSAREPRFTGRIHSDALALPLPPGASSVPLPLDSLRGWLGDVQLDFGRLTVGQDVELHDAAASVLIEDGVLRLRQFASKLGSGSVSGTLILDAAADPPAFNMQGQLVGANIDGPIGDASLGLLSGQAGASLQINADGYSPSAMLATLSGRATVTLVGGSMSGFDMFRLKLAAERPDPVSALAAADDALRSGVTSFDRLQLSATLANGSLMLNDGQLSNAAGEAYASGGINLLTQGLDLRLALRPALPNPPEVEMHLTGPVDHPSRVVELAGLARWLAELVH